MRSVKDFLAPLGAFVILFGLLLVMFLVLPQVGTSTDTMKTQVEATAPAVTSGAIWGWDWISSGSVVMLLIFFGVLFVGLFYIGKAWLKSRYNR